MRQSHPLSPSPRLGRAGRLESVEFLPDSMVGRKALVVEHVEDDGAWVMSVWSGSGRDGGALGG